MSFVLSRSIPKRQRSSKVALVAFSIMAASSRSSSSALSAGHSLSTRFDYEPPLWAKDSLENLPPHGRLALANLPTPLYKLNSQDSSNSSSSSILKKLQELNINLYVKRDDMSGGVETGGNKIRKLEFLLADAKAREYDSVVTIGGEQSNHCRATAAAARMIGLEPHLILRTKRADKIQKEEAGDIGFTGNVLFDRMVGSSIYTCTPGEYGRLGSQELVARLCEYLKENNNCKPYAIPVGGSNSLGTWGYINGVDELLSQWNSIEDAVPLDHIVFACGSGGTAAGIGLGIACAFKDTPADSTPQVHAIGVCDSPDYFYGHVTGKISLETDTFQVWKIEPDIKLTFCIRTLDIANGMGLKVQDGDSTESFVRSSMRVHQGKGLGYAVATPEELEFISKFAVETGIVLDPVYSGKALYNFLTELFETDEGEKYRGKNILFWHTGVSKST